MRLGTSKNALAWFALHLAVVYFSARECTPWFAGRFHDLIVPLFHPEDTVSRLQYLFSHLLAFSFVPGFLAGLASYKNRHAAAMFVWVIPASVLAYQFFTFPASIFQSRAVTAWHEYFGGGFVVPEYRDYLEMFILGARNSDMVRGMDQARFTAPFYAGVAYSLASFLSTRLARFFRNNKSNGGLNGDGH
jgi:hypothetical protein